MIKEVIGNAILYNADCLEATHDIERVDHTITDPPYEAQAHTEFREVYAQGGGLDIKKLDFEAMDEKTRTEITRLVVKITDGWGLFFCQVEGNYYWQTAVENAGGKYHSTMIWVKTDGKPNYRGNGPGIGFENIVTSWCGIGKSVWNGGGKNGVFTYAKNEERTEGNTHLTLKPQKLMRELIALFTNLDQVVFDPFMGSGSTGVAALTLGRKFIGIEKNPEYFETCCRRIEAAQSTMFDAPYVKTKARAVASLLEPAPRAVKAAAKAPPKARKALAPPPITQGTKEKPPAGSLIGQEGPAVAQVPAEPKTALVKPPGLLITAGTTAIKEIPMERSIPQNTGLVRKPWGVK